MARKRLLEPIHPGEILFEEFMKPMAISINRLAREIHVSPGRISAIVNGKHAITADTALRLSRYLGTSSDLWVGLQGSLTCEWPSVRLGRKLRGIFSSMLPESACPKVTPLGLKQVHDPVNLESDIIGKYVERLLQDRGQLPKPTISIAKLGCCLS